LKKLVINILIACVVTITVRIIIDYFKFGYFTIPSKDNIIIAIIIAVLISFLVKLPIKGPKKN
jgi:hypothetical protein